MTPDALTVQLAELRGDIEELRAWRDDCEDTGTTPSTPQPTHHGDLDDFVTHWIAPGFARRQGTDFTWCPHWRDHPEAVHRLTALRAAWEALWPNGGTDPSSYLQLHHDPAMSALTGPAGVFAQCRNGHRTVDPLPYLPRPASLSVAR